jgi:RNA polymerase sigma factor (sigma-70 family)
VNPQLHSSQESELKADPYGCLSPEGSPVKRVLTRKLTTGHAAGTLTRVPPRYLDEGTKRILLEFYLPEIRRLVRYDLGRFGARVQKDDEDDVVQGAIALALASRAPSPAQEFRVWLRRHVGHAVRAWRRQQRRFRLAQELLTPDMVHQQFSPPTPDQAYAYKETRARLHALVQQLTRPQQEVLTYYMDGLNVAEIGHVTERSCRAVRSLLHRAIRMVIGASGRQSWFSGAEVHSRQ